MKMLEMSRAKRMALLAVLLLLVGTITAVVAADGCCRAGYADCDSVEMSRFRAEIDSAHIDTVKPVRKHKGTAKPKKQSKGDNSNRVVPQF